LIISGSNPKVTLLGGKGVGKSTFSRWIVNRFLSGTAQSVLYIDLDPGQAEFTPPGLVSITEVKNFILGPNFSHLEVPAVKYLSLHTFARNLF